MNSADGAAEAAAHQRMWKSRSLRYLLTCAVLVGLCLTVMVLSLGTGSYEISPLDVVQTLAGDGPGPAHFIVIELRLPRALDGMLAGAALGMAGAVFQSLTRNPLGSPDIIGFGAGAAAGGLVAIIVFGAATTTIAVGSVGGGLATATLVYLLAWRKGVQGNRLILVGIGASAVLGACTNYLYVRADIGAAADAAAWTIGSLNGRDFADVAIAAGALALFGPPALILSRRLSVLELGDETASTLGVSPQANRLPLLLIGTCLTAGAVAAAGPIPFVALAAPQLARRLDRAPGPGIAAAGFMGALLVVAADWITMRIFDTSVLPVGVATGVGGGVYLAWLLLRERRNVMSA